MKHFSESPYSQSPKSNRDTIIFNSKKANYIEDNDIFNNQTRKKQMIATPQSVMSTPGGSTVITATPKEQT